MGNRLGHKDVVHYHRRKEVASSMMKLPLTQKSSCSRTKVTARLLTVVIATCAAWVAGSWLPLTGESARAETGASADAGVALATKATATTITDFGNMQGWKLTTYRRSVVKITTNTDPQFLKDAPYSAKIEYDFTKTDFGTVGFEYVMLDQVPPIDTLPKRIGLWVYGDGNRHWLRGKYIDGKGVLKQADFTLEFSGIDWVGWKYVFYEVPPDTPLPIRWHSLRLVEPHEDRKDKGVIYFSNFRAAYEDEDLSGPTVSALSPAPGRRVYTSTPTISATITDDMAGVDPDSIVLTVDGGPAVPTSACTFDPVSGQFGYTVSTASPLADGEHTAQLQVADRRGNAALPPAQWRFTVYTGPDVEAPVVSEVMPAAHSATIPTSTPRVSLRLYDEYSGVAAEDIDLCIDGVHVNPVYNERTGMLFYAPAEPLPDGPHEVSLQASDRSGNSIAPVRWIFTTKDFQPRDPYHFIFDGLADGHDYGILDQHIDPVNADESDFVVFAGDVMDNDTIDYYKLASSHLGRLQKPMLQAIGNHEISGTLSRDHYQQFFGPTIYSKSIGDSLFIVLDSALGQGLSHYDPSQLDYLALMLERNTKTNVFVMVHVPTSYPTDPTASMPPQDGQAVENMLSAYKAAHPEKNIWVIFGHLHTGMEWEKDGVHYHVIQASGGRSSRPTYSQFEVNGNTITVRRVPVTLK